MSNLLLLRICLPLEEIRYLHPECGCFPFYYNCILYCIMCIRLYNILYLEWTNSGRQAARATDFVLRGLIFVGPCHGTCLLSLYWRPELGNDSQTFGKHVKPYDFVGVS
jgi:hypothetical protein